MNKQKAIDTIINTNKKIRDKMCLDYHEGIEYGKACDLAISTLEQQLNQEQIEFNNDQFIRINKNEVDAAINIRAYAKYVTFKDGYKITVERCTT